MKFQLLHRPTNMSSEKNMYNDRLCTFISFEQNINIKKIHSTNIYMQFCSITNFDF
jgi:hypothetical protein